MRRSLFLLLLLLLPSSLLAATACDTATVIAAAGGTVTGSTSGASTLTGTCGSTGGAPEKVYLWTPVNSGVATIQTCGAGTSFDSVLYVRPAASCAITADLACNDDACVNGQGAFRASKI